MQDHPDGKVVLHCGWHHAVESDLPKRQDANYLTFHLKNLTGIDPLTIYQDALTEHLASGNRPYFELIKADEPSMLVNKKGEVFNGEPGNQHVDIFIYHPPAGYIIGRPDWMCYIQEQFKGTDKVDAELERNLRSFNQLSGSQYDLPLIVPAFTIVSLLIMSDFSRIFTFS